jgi:hypothetical protein
MSDDLKKISDNVEILTQRVEHLITLFETFLAASLSSPTQPPSIEDTPVTPMDPVSSSKTVIISGDRIALRHVAKYNQSGYPRMAIYGKTTPERYRYDGGSKVIVGDKVRADGGVKYYHVLPGQSDDYGHTIPENPVLYLPEWATR